MSIKSMVGTFCAFALTTGMIPTVNAATVTFLASGWGASNFSTLSIPTRSIAFDSSDNLYIENISDDNSGTVNVLKLDATSGYTTSSVFASYNTTYEGVTGLDFDGLGSLYVSERSVSGDAGVVRVVDVATQTLSGDVRVMNNHRPTGVDANISGDIFYTGRKGSDKFFGNIYQMDSAGTRSILINDVVSTGIALDASGNIFISTPNKTGLSLLRNSIYMFDPTDLLNPFLIASFDSTVGELTFDNAGNLYTIDNVDNLSIIKLSAVPVPTAIWLFGSGLIGLVGVAKRKTRL